MILTSRALVAAAVSPALALRYPRIGYENYILDLSPAAVTASSEGTDTPKDAPTRPDTAEYWSPTSLPAWLVFDLGSSKTVNYVGIVGNNLASAGCAIRAQLSPDPTVPDPHLSLPGSSGNHASAPDIAAVDIAGDIDLRIKIALNDWTPAAASAVLSKANVSTSTNYRLDVDPAGTLTFRWSAGGVAASKTSTAALGLADGSTKWLRVTHDVNNGAAGNDVKFWTSDDGASWTQLGATVTTAGVVSRDTNAFALSVGSGKFDGTASPAAGKVFYAEVLSGIAGTVVARMDATEAADGAGSWTSSTGEVWTVNTSGAPTARLNNYMVGTNWPGYAPATNDALLFLDTDKAGRYLQIYVTGGSIMPQIPVIYAGRVLVMEKMPSGPFMPITMADDSELHASMSDGGQFLSQGFRRNGFSSSITFKFLTSEWVRANFEPFKKAARRLPYFLAWNPEEFPEEVGYCWTQKPINPTYNGTRTYMDVSWSMRAYGAPE